MVVGTVQQPIEDAREFLTEPAFIGALSDEAVDVLIAFFPAPDEFQYQFGRILQVGAHYYGCVTADVLQAGRDCTLHSEIAREAHDAKARVVEMNSDQFFICRINRAVLDDHDLKHIRWGKSICDGGDAPRQLVDAGLFIEGRHYDRDGLRQTRYLL
jgi:hypothetical protein